MRRADRLFQIIQLLSDRRAVTARYLADELAVSERTIYRDMQDLSLSGVPIESEAGVGYRLMKGFHLPPLMFSEQELAALMIGARMMQVWSDPTLAKAAQMAIRKIENVLPERLKPELARQEIMVPDFMTNNEAVQHLSLLREAIKQQQKVVFNYTREDGQHSQRTIHPLGIFYWGKVWTLTAWCELRDQFRHFRLDRMQQVVALPETFVSVPGRTLDDYLATVRCDS